MIFLRALLALSLWGCVSSLSAGRPGRGRALRMALNERAAARSAQEPDWLKTKTLYDFSKGGRAAALASFERIDDAVMGGISLSKLVDPGARKADAVTWRGIVRTEGGGFCGTRTLPFVEPLNLTGFSGLYITCALTSDQDADRRVWKVVLRTKDGTRGEVVYQAPFKINPRLSGLQRILVPFDAFKLVRGPRLVPNAPPVDSSATGTIYQIGLTASKFEMSAVPKELPNFRSGYFQLDIGEIGAYARDEKAEVADAEAPASLSADEKMAGQPVAVKTLRRVLNVFFNERLRRRGRASDMLAERGLTRRDRARFGFRVRRQQGRNVVVNAATVVAIPTKAAIGTVLKAPLRMLLMLVPRPRAKKEKPGKEAAGKKEEPEAKVAVKEKEPKKAKAPKAKAAPKAKVEKKEPKAKAEKKEPKAKVEKKEPKAKAEKKAPKAKAQEEKGGKGEKEE